MTARPELTEDELTALLHRAVDGLRPEPGGLARIRREIPRRRARRRTAWVGAASTVLVLAAVVPALNNVQFDFTGSPAADRTVADPASATGRPSPTADVPASYPAVPPLGTASPSPTPTATTPGPSTSPTATASAAAVPDCLRTDLGQAETHLGPADGTGRVYGSFLVRNTSAHACALEGPGALTVSAVSGVDPARIRVAAHTAGDPAGQLPDPPAPGPLVLAPQGGYQVQFGWVPDSACGGSPSPAAVQPQAHQDTASPAPAPTAAASGGVNEPNVTSSPVPSTSPTPTATATQAAPSITLAHTPQPGGAPAGTAVLTGACGGTVYWTAPLPLAVASGAPTQAAGR